MSSTQLGWLPEQFGPDEYVIDIGERGAKEVQSALQQFNTLGLDGDAVSVENFHVPVIKELLTKATVQLYDGPGFCVLRGLDPAAFSVEDSLITFLGLASHVGGGLRGVQDRHGNVIGHITNAKTWTAPPAQRHGIHTNTALPFHTDMGASTLALQVRQLAKQGGNLYVASATTALKELQETHPDVVETLKSCEWPVQISGCPPRHIRMPLVQEHQGKLMVSLDPGRLGLYDGSLADHANNRSDGNIPSLTESQREAFRMLNEAAQAHRLQLHLRTGDIVFINNWATLHARDHYVDGDNSRHLLRLWLHDFQNGWSVPDAFKAPWEAAFGVNGDGNSSHAQGKQVYAVVPPLKYKVPRYAVGSAAFLMDDETS